MLQVSGLFDPIVINAIDEAIERSDADGAQALVLQVNSRGAVVGRDEIESLLERVADAPLPVAVWVGPSGARLYGTPAQLLAVADVTGMAPGARVGYTGVPLSPNGVTVDFGAAESALRNGSLGLTDARRLEVFRQRISDEGIPTIVSMVNALDGYEEAGVVLETTEEVVLDDGTVRRDTTATVRFSKLGLIDQLFHTVASPAVTYLLLLIGMALLVFEFFTAGIGVAGVVGAACLVLACTGLVTLPARGWAVALLVAGDAGVRRRRAGRHPAHLDRDRHRPDGGRQLLVVRAASRRDASAVVDHAPRRHRWRGAGVRRRHAVDGADSLRHADDRSGVDGRRARRGRSMPSIRMVWSASVAPAGGRAPTAPRPCQPASRCAWSPSTASPSRSSRWREQPETTVNGDVPGHDGVTSG